MLILSIFKTCYEFIAKNISARIEHGISLLIQDKRLQIYVYNKRTNVFLSVFISICIVEKFMLNLIHFTYLKRFTQMLI